MAREAISRSPRLRSLWQILATAASIASPAHRALLERLLHAGEQFVLFEGLAAAVALDHGRQQQLRGLEGREALGAFQAFAAPANLPPFAGETRVDDLSLRVAAKWAVHGTYLGRVADRAAAAQP